MKNWVSKSSFMADIKFIRCLNNMLRNKKYAQMQMYITREMIIGIT